MNSVYWEMFVIYVTLYQASFFLPCVTVLVSIFNTAFCSITLNMNKHTIYTNLPSQCYHPIRIEHTIKAKENKFLLFFFQKHYNSEHRQLLVIS